MTIQQKLLPLVENIDYAIIDGELIPLPKTRQVEQTIHHEATEEVPAYDEVVLQDEVFFEQLPSLESVKLSIIDVAIAVSEYLSDKQELRDLENDSINIVNNTIHSFNFKNIPHPSVAELLACYEVAIARSSQAAINAEALKYLADTDYLVIRALEDTNKPVSEEIKQLRAAARLRIL